MIPAAAQKANLHTHTCFCDGAGEPAAYCRQAEAEGMAALGFSAHAPLVMDGAPPTEWHLPAARMKDYCAAVLACKKEWAGRLQVFLGLEADYISGGQSPADYAAYQMDYLIGSVHCVPPPGLAPAAFFRQSGTLLCVDGSGEDWQRLTKDFFAGDVYALVDAYWRSVQQMIESGGFAILGHIDLIKKNNQPALLPPAYLFDPNDPFYTRRVHDTADMLAGKDIVVEINTGGINRGRTSETYPSLPFLTLLCERKVPVTISADAHRPEDVCGGFARAVETARAAGYTETLVFQGSSNGSAVWKPMPV